MPAIRPTVRMIYQGARIVTQVTALYLDVDDVSKGRINAWLARLFQRKPPSAKASPRQHYAVRRGVPVNRPHKPLGRR